MINMNKLNAYIDGLLDSGAKSFSRDVIENIKAMLEPEKVQFQPFVHWPSSGYAEFGTGGTLQCDGKITWASTDHAASGGITTSIYNMPYTLTGIDPNPIKATTYDPSF